jgi:hypothetical protein
MIGVLFICAIFEVLKTVVSLVAIDVIDGKVRLTPKGLHNKPVNLPILPFAVLPEADEQIPSIKFRLLDSDFSEFQAHNLASRGNRVLREIFKNNVGGI